MRSRVIKPTPADDAHQLSLSFEPGLAERYGSLRECVATGVYQRGLKRIAIDLDMAPSNLSVQLSEDPSRHFSVGSLETYIDKTGDTTPIYFLIAKYLSSERKPEIEAMAEIGPALAQLVPLLKKAGLV